MKKWKALIASAGIALFLGTVLMGYGGSDTARNLSGSAAKKSAPAAPKDASFTYKLGEKNVQLYMYEGERPKDIITDKSKLTVTTGAIYLTDLLGKKWHLKKISVTNGAIAAIDDLGIIDSTFLKTLDARNLRSGYAEMLKHALIAQPDRLHALLAFDLECPNLYALQALIAESIAVKARIVAQDPHEQQLRKVLNFGHTIGHAFESFAMRRTPILHGYAVAYGMICELYLSHVKCGFPLRELQVAVQFIREHYGRLLITCDDYDELLQWMQHDKKNTSTDINFTFLEDIGKPIINQTATKDEIKEALDFFRETM